ncbi:MAG: hypothetical protein ABIQ65_18945, partial [Thermoanaerobaculia bacterium]
PLLEGFIAFGHRGDDGLRLIDRFLSSHGRDLPRTEVAAIVAMQKSVASLFRVEQVRRGAGFRLKDLVSGESVDVHEVSATATVRKGDVLFAWVMAIRERLELNGPMLEIPKAYVPGILDALNEELAFTRLDRPDVPDRELIGELAWLPLALLRAAIDQAPRPQLQNTDGDPLVWSDARYDVRSVDEVRTRLRAVDVFEEREDGSFGWLGPKSPGSPGRVSLGKIRVDKKKLVLETNSVNRLDRGKALLEQQLGGLITHRVDGMRSLDSFLDEEASPPSAEPKPPSADEIEAMGRYLADHYTRWMDDKLPALRGKTPRQAVRTKKGKLAVSEMLDDIERLNETQVGSEWVDIDAMRRELGLAPTRSEDDTEWLRYDARNAPGASWLEADEGERLAAIRLHHEELAAHPRAENNRLHAGVHLIVENQLASGEAPDVSRAVLRLMAAGASRHEAIHAVGLVLMEEMAQMVQEERAFDLKRVGKELKGLKAAEWMGSVVEGG